MRMQFSLHLILMFCLFSLPALNALTEGEMLQYRKLCHQAAQSQHAYKDLRKNPLHRKVVEPYLNSNGAGYGLQINRESLTPHVLYPILSKWDSKIKGPRCQSAPLFLSPLALRHGQMILELEREFGPLNRLRILQIGAGFGHLAGCLAETTGFASYTLMDSSECLSLQKKFLRDVPHITYLTPSQLHLVDDYDLVICAFPFTEWGNTLLRDATLQKIARIPRGYLSCHAPWHPSTPDNCVEETLLLTLARAGLHVYCAPERGNPTPLHSIIRWGTQETPAPDLTYPIPSNFPQSCSAVVTAGDGGRMGDKLVCHAHAKWVAHHYHLPLLTQPFPYAEAFALSTLYPSLGSSGFKFAHEMHPRNHREISEALSTPSTLFIIDFFAETDFESGHYPYTGTYFYTNWRDRGFLNSLRQDFAPQVALEKPMLDDSDVHVAVHVRLGGGFDDPTALQTFAPHALKSPQHSFYLKQIQRIAKIFPDQSIQLHLFTDDPDPEALVTMYRDVLNNPRLHFTYRATQNGHDRHVLDDFFAMSAYDCLIHPQSYFSSMASLLGDFAVRITPIHATWKTTYWVMDQVECEMDGAHPLFQKTP